MAWTTYQLCLALTMIITGSINTLSTKWADDIESVNRNGVSKKFDHPFFQACCMFLGEFLCLIVFKVLYYHYKRKGDGSEDVMELTKGNRDFNPFKLFIPAMCDMTATSIMYIGLTLTYSSSFQMFRGSVIIFVGILSMAFLERVLKKKEWAGIIFVILGLAIVGVSDSVYGKDSGDHSKNDIITGDLLIIIAQIITAVQMVVEEKFVSGLDIPSLQAVGWEGLFGLVTLGILQVPLYYIKVGKPFADNPNGSLEDAIDAFVQISNSLPLIIAILGTIFSIAFFNFAGISVTKELSATTRMVLDSVRILVIWIVSLLTAEQEFQWLQLLGYIGLVIGMGLYNNITLGGLWNRVGTLINKCRYGNVPEETIHNHTADEREQA
ncbi:solute carrier family 35 member F6-like [Harmonia axyridis]|uniref:solute carrier family 35 member F6-like n=1 Tax=Harmonia axyridis TaxID=115357 RepID=UPI001E276841|nr:solute carrier family 35 member F6-like [Harmonia axyridis]